MKGGGQGCPRSEMWKGTAADACTELGELPLPLSQVSTEKSESQQLWCVSGVSAILISRHFSQQN